MNEIKVFGGPGIRAGFTQRPLRSQNKRAELAKEARDNGGIVLWPYLVHGTRIAVCKAGPDMTVPRASDFISLDSPEAGWNTVSPDSAEAGQNTASLDGQEAGRSSAFDGILRYSLSFTGSALSTDEASNRAWTDKKGGDAPGFEWRSEHLLGIGGTDGCVTNVPGVILTSTHGDCLPLMIFDPERRAIGLAHAGWRGTLDGIAVVLAETMIREYGSDPSDMHCWIGPGIDFECFEVGENVAMAFLDRFAFAEEMVASKPVSDPADGVPDPYPGPKYLVDLKSVNEELFKLCGIPEENIEIDPACTCCDAEHYYSHRRAKEKDRMLAYIYLER